MARFDLFREFTLRISQVQHQCETLNTCSASMRDLDFTLPLMTCMMQLSTYDRRNTSDQG
jgi:hypothetical protein